jgi:HD-GYP domain-containing protein (c-di-GMP phosphodiesterase class II)
MSFSENNTTQENSFDENLLKISALMDKFEGYEHSHAERIAVLVDAVAQKFNLASHDRLSLKQAALVHDIGEVVMNRNYIQIKRLLTEQERVDMQRHPVQPGRSIADSLASRMVERRWLSRRFGASADSACRPNFACR